jgi:hypothetical protein
MACVVIVGIQNPNNGVGDSLFTDGHFEFKTTFEKDYKSQQGRCGLQLLVETVPM